MPQPAATCRFRFTSRDDGDLRGNLSTDDDATVDDRRALVAPLPWSWLRQVHGRDVVTVRAPGEWAGTEADGLVTDRAGCTLAVFSADCAPVALVADGSDGGRAVVGVAHAGWRGVAAGIVEATVAAMRALGADRIEAHLGPCIRPGRYEFGPADLAEVVDKLGPGVASTTAWGTLALDVPAAVRAALARAGVDTVTDDGTCTAASDTHFSHRARGDRGRQAGVVWLEPVT